MGKGLLDVLDVGVELLIIKVAGFHLGGVRAHPRGEILGPGKKLANVGDVVFYRNGR